MNCSTADERLRIVRPCRLTEAGSWLIAVCTRLLTLTVSMSGFEPRSNETVSVYEPSLPEVDFM